MSVGTFLDDAGFERFMDDFARRFASFAGRVGDRLSAERKELYERFLRAAPRLLARYRSHEDLTIVHGDAHVWNLLYPRDPASERVRLIDWEGWRVEGWPVLLGSRHPMVHELGRLPAASRREGAEGGQLVLGSLL